MSLKLTNEWKILNYLCHLCRHSQVDFRRLVTLSHLIPYLLIVSHRIRAPVSLLPGQFHLLSLNSVEFCKDERNFTGKKLSIGFYWFFFHCKYASSIWNWNLNSPIYLETMACVYLNAIFLKSSEFHGFWSVHDKL